MGSGDCGVGTYRLDYKAVTVCRVSWVPVLDACLGQCAAGVQDFAAEGKRGWGTGIAPRESRVTKYKTRDRDKDGCVQWKAAGANARHLQMSCCSGVNRSNTQLRGATQPRTTPHPAPPRHAISHYILKSPSPPLTNSPACQNSASRTTRVSVRRTVRVTVHRTLQRSAHLVRLVHALYGSAVRRPVQVAHGGAVPHAAAHARVATCHVEHVDGLGRRRWRGNVSGRRAGLATGMSVTSRWIASVMDNVVTQCVVLPQGTRNA